MTTSAPVGNEVRVAEQLMLPIASRHGACVKAPVKISIPAWVDFDAENAAPFDLETSYRVASVDTGAMSCPVGILRKRRQALAQGGIFDVDVCDVGQKESPKVADVKNMDAHTSRLACVPPGLGLPTGTPSHGSVLHSIGECKPCAWFWKPRGCQNGADCRHCHSCPEGEIKARKKNKYTMMRLGLVTPKVAENEQNHTPSFCFEAGMGLDREQEASTACTSSDHEFPSNPSSEDDSSNGPLEKHVDVHAVAAFLEEPVKIEINHLLGVYDRGAGNFGDKRQGRPHRDVSWMSSECSTYDYRKPRSMTSA